MFLNLRFQHNAMINLKMHTMLHTQPLMDQMTRNFACEELWGTTFDFCPSQCHVTPIEVNHIWRPDTLAQKARYGTKG